METIQDFEDLLDLLDRHGVRYFIIGGLAFIYMDLWIDPRRDNVERANRALAEFGSPHLLDPSSTEEILQLGLAPNRIDLLMDTGALPFDEAWERRIEGMYGRARALWIDLDGLIDIKSRIDDPKHAEDVRVLRKVKERRERG
jgi:hypothetical protein